VGIDGGDDIGWVGITVFPMLVIVLIIHADAFRPATDSILTGNNRQF
jgi:hypothetical protein